MEYFVPVAIFVLSTLFLYRKFKQNYVKGKCSGCSVAGSCGKIEVDRRDNS